MENIAREKISKILVVMLAREKKLIFFKISLDMVDIV